MLICIQYYTLLAKVKATNQGRDGKALPLDSAASRRSNVNLRISVAIIKTESHTYNDVKNDRGNNNMATQPSINPYQPPQVNLANDYADDQDSYWRDGKVLVLKRDRQLPPRCVKCNADAKMPMLSKTLRWHHPGWYALILINIVIYAIIGSIASKRAKIEFGLCEEHAARRRNVIIASWVIFLGSIGLAIWTGKNMDDGGVPIAILIAGMFIALLTALIGAPTLYAKRITDQEIRISGCGEPFLDSTMQRVQLKSA